MQKRKKAVWKPPEYFTRYYSTRTLVEENGHLGNNNIEHLVSDSVVSNVNEIIACQLENVMGSKNIKPGDLIMDTSLFPSERGEGCVLLSRCSLGDEFICTESTHFPEIFLRDSTIDVTLSNIHKGFLVGKILADGTVKLVKNLKFQRPSDRMFSLRLTSEKSVLIRVPVKFWLI